MTQYLLRLDDASDYMDTEKWGRMTELLDRYAIKPIFGIIPQNRDEVLVSRYTQNSRFWGWVHQRIAEGWTPAMHGYEHRYVTEDGGLNPIQKRSEFAGLPYEDQRKKIAAGYAILQEHGIAPEIFFAPSHTFDENTLRALQAMTPIRVISDTIACDIYKSGDFWFIPQQSGLVRRLPLRAVTFCYHPNTMNDGEFGKLEKFLDKQKSMFVSFSKQNLQYHTLGIFDYFLRQIYFLFH